MPLSDPVKAVEDELIALRRELHAHPELAGQERWTQARILSFLKEAGVQARPFAGTGVIGRIPGRAPGPATIARADMDALPITEQTGLPFTSLNPGCMHACGHDAHVAMLLMAARLLIAAPARGDVELVFQPAEERGQGAEAMLAAGLLDERGLSPRGSFGRALALHVWSGLPSGSLVCRDGPALASVDTFELTVQGRGSHAARPEDGLDPIPIAAQIVTAAQSLVARRLAPHQAAVLSFTAIEGGQAFNVIPDEVRLRGTARAFEPQARDLLVDGLVQIATDTAAAFGARVRYQGFERLPPLINDPAVPDGVRRAAAGLLGEQNVLPGEPLMVGEDFGLISQRVPGAMALLGCGDPRAEEVFAHHHPRFQIDERVLGVGVELWLRLLAGS